MERRCRFLSECVSELGLANVTVLRGRAEDAAVKAAVRADVATARAVAPLTGWRSSPVAWCGREEWFWRSRGALLRTS